MILTVFRIVLTLSLAGNAALAWFVLVRPVSLSDGDEKTIASVVSKVTTRSAGDTDAAAASGARPSAASAEDRALLLETAMRYGRMPRMGDPRALAAWMVREGYPPDVVQQVVSAHLHEWLGGEDFNHEKAARSGDPDGVRLYAIYDYNGAYQNYMRDLFPLWGERLDRQQAYRRKLRFGDMPLETVVKVEQRERDANKVRQAGPGGRMARAEMKEKLLADLRTMLTPEQHEDYLRYNSSAAERLRQEIRTLEIDEPTYNRLYAVAAAHSPSPLAFPPIEQYREILGDAQTAQLISAMQSNIAEADRVYVAAGLSATQRVDFYLLVDRVSYWRRYGVDKKEAARTALAQIRAAVAGSQEGSALFEASYMARMLRGNSGEK